MGISPVISVPLNNGIRKVPFPLLFFLHSHFLKKRRKFLSGNGARELEDAGDFAIAISTIVTLMFNGNSMEAKDGLNLHLFVVLLHILLDNRSNHRGGSSDVVDNGIHGRDLPFACPVQGFIYLLLWDVMVVELFTLVNPPFEPFGYKVFTVHLRLPCS
jgi:hypothetical protein